MRSTRTGATIGAWSLAPDLVVLSALPAAAADKVVGYSVATLADPFLDRADEQFRDNQRPPDVLRRLGQIARDDDGLE